MKLNLMENDDKHIHNEQMNDTNIEVCHGTVVHSLDSQAKG